MDFIEHINYLFNKEDKTEFEKYMRNMFDEVYYFLEETEDGLTEQERAELVSDLISSTLNELDHEFEWEIVGYYETMKDYYNAVNK